MQTYKINKPHVFFFSDYILLYSHSQAWEWTDPVWNWIILWGSPKLYILTLIHTRLRWSIFLKLETSTQWQIKTGQMNEECYFCFICSDCSSYHYFNLITKCTIKKGKDFYWRDPHSPHTHTVKENCL